MNPKFLLFVPENTPLEIIEEKLKKANTDIPDYVILGFLMLIHKKGLKNVRSLVDKNNSSNEALPLATQYELLLNSEKIHISPTIIPRLTLLKIFLTTEDFGVSNRKNLLVDYVYSVNNDKNEQYLNLKLIGSYENDSIPEGLFSDNGIETEFESKEELLMYIFYKEYINKKETPPLFATYSEIPF